MNVITTKLAGLVVIEPKVFGDARGFFLESYNAKALDAAIGGPYNFVQDNHSRSSNHVLRGLHYQIGNPQGKLVRVVRGRAFDVAVDLRKLSPTFGQWAGIELSEDNHRQMWIPPGFAHGFLTQSDVTDFLYKTTDYYTPAEERCLAWNDPTVGIEWPISVPPTLSDKDRRGVTLADADCFI